MMKLPRSDWIKEMVVLTRSKKPRKTESSSAFLKVVHPRGYIEIFREPISAGEILTRYPRHCIARPDFFEYPWIVVRPESVLVPGEVFFLVSHKTVDKVLKRKGQESRRHHHHHPASQHECGSSGREEQDSDSRSLYKSSFYESWNEMQRTLLSPHDDQLHLELQRVKSCLKKADSDRKNLNLKVSFRTSGV